MFAILARIRLRRLALVLLGTGCLAAADARAAQSTRHFFEVLLDGKPIGTHEFQVARTGTAERVLSTARFDVRLLGIAVYRYRHGAEEHWDGGCLLRIDARTSDNGPQVTVRGARGEGGFQVESPEPQRAASACVSSYAYWDPVRLLASTRLLNPQTGRFDTVKIDLLGEEVILVRGERRSARRYRIGSDAPAIELWYSPQGEWLQLASTVRGDRKLLYRLAD
jgi:hypothetical protein